MSGRDEKPMSLLKLDFPHCSYCDDFEYWRGIQHSNRERVYFNPLSYQESHKALPVVVYVGAFIADGRIPTLQEIEDVKGITCNGCGTPLQSSEQQAMKAKAVKYIEWAR